MNGNRSYASYPQGVDCGYDWQTQTEACVLLYIDNSNIFESAKKHSSIKKGYRNGIPDVACRIDIGKLISRAVENRKLLLGKLYGSEPPALDTVWDAIRRKHVHVETFQRSNWTLKEKQLDSSLTADAVDDIISMQEQAGHDRTLILFSGDRDLLRVVDKAIKYGYKVEIWSFKSSINNMVKRRASEKPSTITVNNIDDIFDEITYTKVLWGKTKIPKERSIVASVTLTSEDDKKQILRTVVAKAGETFQLPMMGKYIDKYKYIVLVPCIKEQYTPPHCLGKAKNDSVRTYDFYKHIQPFMHILEEHFSYCSDITPWLKFISQRKLNHTQDILTSTRFQYLDETFEHEIKRSEGPLSDDESLDADCNDFFDALHEDFSDEDSAFVPVIRKEIKAKRLYSTFCNYKFWCSKGSDCSHKHTDQHKQFFKVQTDASRRKLYKTKPCYNNFCEYSREVYMCPYAHTLQESRCLCCKGKGSGVHWMDQCPLNRYKI